MNNFLKSGAIYEEGRLAKILKCVQQEIIFPAVMELRTEVYPIFPYKDIKVCFHLTFWYFFKINLS